MNLALVLLMLAAAIVTFVINRPRMDAVTLLVMAAIPFTGIITMNEALAGFADPSIILIADVHASKERTNELWDSLRLEPRLLSEIANYFVDRSQEIGAAEVILPAESTLIGQTVLDARIRSEYGLTVIGMRHGNKVVRHDLLKERLKIGDTLLMIGFWSDIRDLQSHTDDVVLNMPAELEEVLPAAQRAPHALADGRG
jgi:di/tricarboxylate transporter